MSPGCPLDVPWILGLKKQVKTKSRNTTPTGLECWVKNCGLRIMGLAKFQGLAGHTGITQYMLKNMPGNDRKTLENKHSLNPGMSFNPQTHTTKQTKTLHHTNHKTPKTYETTGPAGLADFQPLLPSAPPPTNENGENLKKHVNTKHRQNPTNSKTHEFIEIPGFSEMRGFSEIVGFSESHTKPQ